MNTELDSGDSSDSFSSDLEEIEATRRLCRQQLQRLSSIGESRNIASCETISSATIASNQSNGSNTSTQVSTDLALTMEAQRIVRENQLPLVRTYPQCDRCIAELVELELRGDDIRNKHYICARCFEFLTAQVVEFLRTSRYAVMQNAQIPHTVVSLQQTTSGCPDTATNTVISSDDPFENEENLLCSWELKMRFHVATMRQLMGKRDRNWQKIKSMEEEQIASEEQREGGDVFQIQERFLARLGIEDDPIQEAQRARQPCAPTETTIHVQSSQPQIGAQSTGLIEFSSSEHDVTDDIA